MSLGGLVGRLVPANSRGSTSGGRPPLTSTIAPVVYGEPSSGQPEYRVRHLVGRAAGAASGSALRESRGAIGLAAAGVDLGVDDAGPHRVDPHALGRDLVAPDRA